MVAPANKRFLLESDKGVANGLATLGANGKIPPGQAGRSPIVDVADYYPGGYVPGVTDVKSAFDAAVTACPEGGTVQFEPGADYFLTYGEPITKALTVDANMSSFTVDPTPGAGTAGKPVFYFTGTPNATAHPIAATAAGQITVTTSVPAAAANYAVGDVVIVSDSTQVLPWDSDIPGSTPLYPAGYVGREELNTVQTVNAATGVVTLLKPVEWAYATSPTIRKIDKMLQSPKVINIKRMHEIDPGGLNTSTLIGANAPHLVHFQHSHTPVAQNLHFDGWNCHAVNFHRCTNVQHRDTSGKNPYRPTDGGHGYLSRLDRCRGGHTEGTYSERVRHHIDYVMTVDTSQSNNVAVSPISAAYAWHGLGARRSTSTDDKVVDSGVGWGWMIGNLAFGPDFDVTITNPSYNGTGTPIVFHAKAQNLKVVNPDLHTTARCITMTTGAAGLDVRGGTLETVGASASANTLLVRDKAAAGDAYGLRPGNARVAGTRLRGVNPSISVDSSGSVRLLDLVADEANSGTVGGTVNLITIVSQPAALRIAGNRFAGTYTNGVSNAVAAPAGEYAIELNDVRGHTSRAVTTPAAANLRFVGNTANNNGGGLNPWNITGDLNAAKAGAADYAAVVIGNSPRTLDEARVTATVVDGAAGTARAVSFSTAGVLRWIFRATSAAETGADAGTDIELVARTDAGAAGPQLFLGKRTGDLVLGAFGKKLGFFGSAGTTRQTLAAAATDAATTQTLVNDLRTKLINTGLFN